jgi:hypothetical protein
MHTSDPDPATDVYLNYYDTVVPTVIGSRDEAMHPGTKLRPCSARRASQSLFQLLVRLYLIATARRG